MNGKASARACRRACFVVLAALVAFFLVQCTLLHSTPASPRSSGVSAEAVISEGTVQQVQLVRSFHPHLSPWRVEWSPDGATLGVSGFSLHVAAFDAKAFTQRFKVSLPGLVGDVAFSPDSTLLAASFGGCGHLRLFHTDTGEEQVLLRSEEESFADLAFSPDGRYLACGGARGVHLWQTAGWGEAKYLELPEYPVLAIAFSPDGRLLAAGGMGGTVRVWRLPQGRLVRVLSTGPSVPQRLAFSPDGRWLAAGTCAEFTRCLWGDLLVWRVGRWKMVRLWRGEGQVTDLAFSPDGSLIAFVTGGNTLRFWGVRAGQETRVLPVQRGCAHDLAFSPDGRYLAVVGCWVSLYGVAEE